MIWHQDKLSALHTVGVLSASEWTEDTSVDPNSVVAMPRCQQIVVSSSCTSKGRTRCIERPLAFWL